MNLTNGIRFNRAVREFITFFGRHFFASIISIVVAIVFTVIAYFTLLIVAIVTNSGLGGPLSLPFFIVAAGVLSLLYTACLLFPSVALAELVSKRMHPHKYIAQALISTITLAILIFMLAFITRQKANIDNLVFLNLVDYPVSTFLVLCIPLGLYWWATKIIQATTTGIIALWKRFVRNEEVN